MKINYKVKLPAPIESWQIGDKVKFKPYSEIDEDDKEDYVEFGVQPEKEYTITQLDFSKCPEEYSVLCLKEVSSYSNGQWLCNSFINLSR